jgi:hypothetical protein
MAASAMHGHMATWPIHYVWSLQHSCNTATKCMMHCGSSAVTSSCRVVSIHHLLRQQHYGRQAFEKPLVPGTQGKAGGKVARVTKPCSDLRLDAYPC